MSTPPPARLAWRQKRSFRPAGLEENFRDRMSQTHCIRLKWVFFVVQSVYILPVIFQWNTAPKPYDIEQCIFFYKMFIFSSIVYFSFEDFNLKTMITSPELSKTGSVNDLPPSGRAGYRVKLSTMCKLHVKAAMMFQQAGVSPHWSNVLDRHFPRRGVSSHVTHRTSPVSDTSWVERMDRQCGSIAWPTRSPDIILLDFILWGYVKDCLPDTYSRSCYTSQTVI